MRATSRHHHRQASRIPTFFAIAVALVLGATAAGFAVFGLAATATVAYLSEDLPDPSGLASLTFDQPTIDQIEAGATQTATATITPSANAIAGDYVVTLSASTEGANESLQVRVTVETSPIWGIVGILLILAAIGGLVWVFRRYGRR